MLCFLADKALICGRIWFVSWCFSLCLGSMAMGPCSQHSVNTKRTQVRWKTVAIIQINEYNNI